MKVLQISKYYPPHLGGVEQLAYDISRILIGNKDEVRVVCFNDSKQSYEEMYDNVKIYRIGSLCKVASQSISVKYLFDLQKIIKDFIPDVIHIHLPNPLIVVYLLLTYNNIPITVHWHSDIIKQKKMKKIYAPFEKKLLKKCVKIIATSRIYAENSDVLKLYLDKVVVIPSIVNADFLSRIDDNDKIEINEIRNRFSNKKIIFFFGVHRVYKGLCYLIQAAKYISGDYHIVIGGDGDLTADLKTLAKNLNNVSFIGRLTENQKKCYLYASDVFAFPSISKNEAFGISLAEALFCGLPAVTFSIDGSGVNWVNQDKITGLVVKEFDAEKYARALMKVSKAKYGVAAKEWARKNFTEEVISDKIKVFFNSILK